MKKIIVILDGASGLPCKTLKGKTPLEAANTPNLDFLTENGINGIMWPINKEIAPESDQAMLALLGFDPFKYYTGRGPLEAYGSGIDFRGKIAIRCNFSEIKNGYITKIQGASEKETRKFSKLLSTEKIKIIPTIGYRAVMLLSTKSSPRVTNTHPGYKIVKNFVTSAKRIAGRRLKERKCRPLESAAKETAKIINDFVYRAKRILKNKTIILRGAGNRLPKLKKLPGKWALLADMPVEKAIGKLTGMKILEKSKNLKKTFYTIKNNFKKFDNFYLQIKGPDTFGHAGDPLGKKSAIEKIDEEFISRLLKLDAFICVTADHSTPCKYMAHSKNPVPIVMYGGFKDKVKIFSEKACRNGKIGKIYGVQMLKILENYINKST